MRKVVESVVGVSCAVLTLLFVLAFVGVPLYVAFWSYTGQDVLVGTTRTETDIPRTCLIASHIRYDQADSEAWVKGQSYKLPNGLVYRLEHYPTYTEAVTGTVLRYGVMRCVSVGPWSFTTTEDYIGHT